MSTVTHEERKQAEALQFATSIAEIVGKLANLTGKYWAVVPVHSWCCHIRNCTGEIYCRLEKGRLKFSGVWPVSNDNHTFRPDDQVVISVSRDRDPASVAKDLKRRLVDWYEEQLPIYEQKAREYNQQLHEQHEVAEKISEMLGGSGYKATLQTPRFSAWNYGIRDVEVYSDATVKIETSHLPADLAMKIIELLKEACSQCD